MRWEAKQLIPCCFVVVVLLLLFCCCCCCCGAVVLLSSAWKNVGMTVIVIFVSDFFLKKQNVTISLANV